MADTFIQAAADGAGKKLDTRTESTNSEHRQVVVIGDPATNAGVAPVDATNGLSVNVTNAALTVGTHAVTQSGTWTVQPGNTANTTPWLAKISDGTNAATIKAASTLPAATDPALVVTIRDQNANGQTTMGNSTPVVMASDFVGTSGYMKKEDVASADGDAGIPAMAVRKATPADTSGTDGDYEFLNVKDGLLWTRLGAATTGGLTLSSTLIASGTNATSVKASAGQIYKIEIFNNSANIAYLKLYNTAGTPTAGSGTPVARMMVPGSASGAGAISTTDLGLTFATGIGFTFTGGIADADTTSVAASAYILNIYYK